MLKRLVPPALPGSLYPDDDGKRWEEGTKHARWMTLLMVNLSGQFMNQEDVFVAMNLLWYAQEGEPTVRQDPDVMVSFGRHKGERGSYRQWLEGGIAPQVVFEIVTPGLPQQEISDTYRFYKEHGVEEYYAFIPDTNIRECRCRATTSGRCYKAIRKNECNKCQPFRLRRETMPKPNRATWGRWFALSGSNKEPKIYQVSLIGLHTTYRSVVL